MSRFHCERALVGGVVETDVDIEVAQGRFSRVVNGVRPDPDATRLWGLTIPGMANSHSHAFHRALRSRTQAERGSFWTWRDVMYRAAARLTPDNYLRLARATFAEMAMAGVTSVGEFHYVHHQPDGTTFSDPNEMGSALLAAAQEAGIRITLLDTVYLHGGLGPNGYTPAEGAQRRYCDPSAEAWATRVDDLHADQGQLIGAAIHSVRAVDPEAMSQVAQWSSANAAPLHAHLSEQRVENEQCIAAHGVTPIQLCDRASVLSPRFTAVHATHPTRSDIALLRDHQAVVCLCPTTERDLGDGVGPTRDFAANGIRMTLGSDSHAVIDMFEESRALELDERLMSEERGIHDALELLTMATATGQSSIGWHDAGVIEVGARADLVTVALDSVRTAGTGSADPVSTVVFAASGADVRSVMVDGRLVVDDHRHLSVDTAAELESAITDLLED